jgi:uncharacterized damage-inducible protein DinB
VKANSIILLVVAALMVTGCQTEEPVVVADCPCTRSAVRVDVSSVEKLLLEPEAVLADIERFWREDSAYRLVSKWHARNDQPRNIEDWQRRIRAIADLSADERQEHPQLEAARGLSRIEQSFASRAIPYLCTFLPPEADLSTTFYFAAEIMPSGIQIDNDIVIHILNHRLQNLFVHELYHRGQTSLIDTLAAARQRESDPVFVLYRALQFEGVATYVGYMAQERFPQIGKRGQSLVAGDYHMLDDPDEVMRLRAELNQLLREAPRLEPDTLHQRQWELGVQQRAFYVVGAEMARVIDQMLGREVLIETLKAGPRAFLHTYNRIAGNDTKIIEI